MDCQKAEVAKVESSTTAGGPEKDVAESVTGTNIYPELIPASDCKGCEKGGGPALVPVSIATHRRNEDPP